MLNIKQYKIKELPYSSNSLLKWIWYFVKPFKKRFFILSINRIVWSALFLSAPVIVSLLIDFVNSADFELNSNKGYYYLFYIFILFSIWNLSAYFRKYETFFRDELKRKLTIFSTIHNLNLPLSWHENQWTWNKMQRIIKARDSFYGLLSLFFWNILQQTWKLLMVFISLAIFAPFYISLIFILYSLLFLVIAYFKSTKIWKLTEIVNIYYEKVIWKWYEFASSIFSVKFFNLNNFIENRSKLVEHEQMWRVFNLIDVIFNKWVYLNFYGTFGYIIIGPIALYLLIDWSITLWVFTMILWYIWTTWDSIEVVWDIQDDYIEHKSWFMMLINLLKVKWENLDIDPIKKFSKSWDYIDINNLSFSYNNKLVIKNFNFNIKNWEKIALVGKSGSWKSTFIKLLMKQVAPTGWNILFSNKKNNININNIKRNELLKNISVVLQDTELFNTSIEENILLDFNWTKKEKKKLLDFVLKMSHSDIFVNELPNKEKTVIWERGVKLSWWEKQRIWIARVLARQTGIIVFDEATSSLDSKSEREIQKAMKEIFKWKTAIIIAHRLSTIKEVDRILVFKKWKIIESGSFDELIKVDWEFGKLWKLQKLD